ncbi:hypothetical protein J7K41_01355 [Candidatus Micrarchaeota archaeon]|nr:hypothetical protein [Candidatus Micrarchaeota archaeon]
MKSAVTVILLLLTVQNIIAYSLPGQGCNTTSDCAVGYCENNRCVLPHVKYLSTNTSCNVTADCKQGYCQDNVCIVPVGGERVVSIGFQSGCTGLITCPMDRPECMILCNLIWVLLITVSAVGGYVSRNHINKLVPLSMVFLPFVTALLTAPIGGVVIGIVETLGYHYMRPSRES